ncbi:MAG: aspartate--ammonia ligase [Anaerococcus vaginalis]|uniref:aspartate--ammonia ligase n=1 Tax=Anaerococcus vaginalis TaxID=33037 RepID=UPI00189B22F7|nr:aspartate--ammonia ligase [Anaerococcus vaginalis]MDU7686296.1 aspartate--ammonia ligase [Bacillota bacterium]MDU4378660.1 aspartate--ammonia ligase [Anaerococcus vaginalis]MDU5824794.1 aspartate--ammonia ligase [Anaerococcus vaginalis]MDU7143605.1 aspartate--ammonia ligase [Anaerococcus vaginalis]MDU7649938.1 aspartate--ammonia ligase [Anaerococcus vaginalis]
MQEIKIPENYQSDKNLYKTQMLIKEIKDFFQINLSNNLNLKRVSAPLFVENSTGLNDNLSGVEEPVKFTLPEANNEKMEIVHSLAKWKRYALKEYNFAMYEGLYTDMNAIRRCEVPDNTHSFYVDQWDWEKVIDPSDRNVDYLKATVLTIFNTLRALDEYLCHLIPKRVKLLPNNIKFMTSQELIDEFPECKDSKEREKAACKKYKAIFLMQIGKVLSNGEVHDLRAPDYDDWNLNGDILVYNPVLDDQLELSSMGIRVDAKTLKEQLNISDCEERLNYKYHKLLVNNELPQTIGGGIGQSRLCMFFLQKAHIGEVQVSYWPDEMREELKKNSVILL